VANRLLALGKAFQPPTVDDKDIQPIVLVIVEERHAAASGFEQIFVLVLAAVDRLRGQPGGFGDIHKAQAERSAGDGRSEFDGFGLGVKRRPLHAGDRLLLRGRLGGRLSQSRPRQP